MIRWPKDPDVGHIYVNPSGSKWKWNGKGWFSLKESDIVYLTGPTGPQGEPGKSSITYQLAHGPMDPVDNMSYFIGNIPDSPAQSNDSIVSKRVKSLISGKAKQVSIMTQIGGELGSSESQTFILKNFTTNTQVTLVSNYTHLKSSQLDNYILTTPLDIEKDDELEIIWQVPTFSTSPTIVRHSFVVYAE